MIKTIDEARLPQKLKFALSSDREEMRQIRKVVQESVLKDSDVYREVTDEKKEKLKEKVDTLMAEN